MLSLIKSLIPHALADFLRVPYHFGLQLFAALIRGFPARRLVVIGVTGTKGKTTVCEMLYAALTATGEPVALASTLRFVTPRHEERNLFKMTVPGRGFIQHFLARAVRDGARYAIVELTSEGARLYRHRFLSLDALIVTNIHPEHIESHGSFEKYVAAKREIVRELERSTKRPRMLVANVDINETAAFLDAQVETRIPFSAKELVAVPPLRLPGKMTRMNALAVIKLCAVLGVNTEAVERALQALTVIRGRLEEITSGGVCVIVDYAHTPESLEALYRAYPGAKVCVLGNTGGGRDRWKRPAMGAIADRECETVILTDEDPYDEDPRAILNEIAAGMKRVPRIILDRREAIRTAIEGAGTLKTVIISGKGTDPYIMGKNGTKTPWDDATVVREELAKMLH